jgi:eukaryotic-like serine/threonine-protein kinase
MNVDNLGLFQDRATGFSGWRMKLSSGRGIPTPAVSQGRVLVGGGFGSYDFYALEAGSGRLAWHQRTKDDGPTAAVIEDDFAAFNTESCTLEVVAIRSGQVVWEKWLGDPLMAQPAIDGGRVFMAYPRDGSHYLGAFQLIDGKPLWLTRIDHDVISAPVVAEGRVYLSTFDGTVWCVDPVTGRVDWSQQMKATSAPWIYWGQVYVARREAAPTAETRQSGDPTRTRSEGLDQIPWERVSRHDSRSGAHLHSSPSKMASYLHRQSGAARKATYHLADAAVGFAQSPGSAKLEQVAQHLGEDSIARAWRYQGSRPVVVDGIIYDITGDRLEAREVLTDRLLWSWQDSHEVEGERRMTPLAAANGRVWAGTWDGRILSWDGRSGKVRWEVKLGAPCHWQPVLDQGRVYAGLEDGSLVGFDTGDPHDTGWPMWGGGPGHNGLPVPEPSAVRERPPVPREPVPVGCA